MNIQNTSYMLKHFLGSLIVLPSMLYAQETFRIRGTFQNPGQIKKVYLRFPGGEEVTTITNGAFVFEGKVEEPFPAFVFADHGDGVPADNSGGDGYFISIEQGELLLEARDSIKGAKVTGGPINMDLVRFNEMVAAESKRMDVLQAALRDPGITEDERREVGEQSMALTTVFHEKQRAFIRDNPDRYFSLMMLRDYVKFSSVDTPQVKRLFQGLSPELRSSATGMALAKDLNTKTYELAVGELAPEIVQADTSGKVIRLSDLRGKYVLIDFWASWCKPCRVENPNLVKLYKQFKHKNFAILGVSLDVKKAAWTKAIQDDKLTWLHVSDLKFWQNEAAVQYRIGGVPQNFLVDPQGRIIATSLYGVDLYNEVARVLN